MIMLGFKSCCCRKYTSFLHNKPFLQSCVLSQSQNVLHRLPRVLFPLFSVTPPAPPTSSSPSGPACLGERSVHCDLWPLTEADREVFRPTFNSCPPLFHRIPLQRKRTYLQTIVTISKISHWAWRCEIQYACPSHTRSEVRALVEMVEMTFWFTDAAPFPCLQRTSDITRKVAWAGLLERGQHHGANAGNINPHSKLPN